MFDSDNLGGADLLRAKRAALRLSQEQVAEATGISRDRLSRIESGVAKHVRVDEALAIRRELGIPVEAWGPHDGSADNDPAGASEPIRAAAGAR